MSPEIVVNTFVTVSSSGFISVESPATPDFSATSPPWLSIFVVVSIIPVSYTHLRAHET